MAFTCNTTKWQGTGQNPALSCPKQPYRVYELEDIRAGLRDSIDPQMQASLALCGTPQFLTGVSTSTNGKFYCAISCLNDTVLNVVATNTTMQDGAGADVSLAALSAIVLPAGTVLYGNFSKVVLVSGTVQLMPHPFL